MATKVADLSYHHTRSLGFRRMPVMSTASYFTIPLNLSPFEQAEYGIPLLWPKEEALELLRGTGTQMYLLYSNKSTNTDKEGTELDEHYQCVRLERYSEWQDHVAPLSRQYPKLFPPSVYSLAEYVFLFLFSFSIFSFSCPTYPSQCFVRIVSLASHVFFFWHISKMSQTSRHNRVISSSSRLEGSLVREQ